MADKQTQPTATMCAFHPLEQRREGLMSSVMSMAQDAVDRLEKFRDLLIRFHSDQNRSAASMARWQDQAAALLTQEMDDVRRT